jgi:hypothetical protein
MEGWAHRCQVDAKETTIIIYITKCWKCLDVVIFSQDSQVCKDKDKLISLHYSENIENSYWNDHNLNSLHYGKPTRDEQLQCTHDLQSRECIPFPGPPEENEPPPPIKVFKILLLLHMSIQPLEHENTDVNEDQIITINI